MIETGLFAAGTMLLVGGAELLVRGSSGIALRFGVAPVVVGLTIVSAGTSAPEVVTGIVAATGDHGDLALGNVVGSNIFNVMFILGLVAVVAPVVVHQRLVRFDVPLLIALSTLVLFMGRDGQIGAIDGAVLVVGFLFYVSFSLRMGQSEPEVVRREYEEAFSGRPPHSVVRDLGFVATGVLALVAGSYWVVNGAVGFARFAGVSELVVGLTVVAAGTGLPELATSLVAVVRGERDIAVGNVVGSNVLNILLVLGVLGIAVPDGVPVAPAALRFDLPVMIALAIACLPIFVTGYRIDRWEGVVLFGYYVAYTGFVLLRAKEHAALPTYSAIMLWFVIPLTVITFVVVVCRYWRPTWGTLRLVTRESG